MPQASDKLRAAFPGSMEQAIAELKAAGFMLREDWTWTHPEKNVDDCTEREIDAIVYLIHEWDFGGMR